MSIKDTILSALPVKPDDGDAATVDAVRAVLGMEPARLPLLQWLASVDTHNDANRPIGMDPGEVRWIRVAEIPDVEFGIGYAPQRKFIGFRGEMQIGATIMHRDDPKEGEDVPVERFETRFANLTAGAIHVNDVSRDVCRWCVRGWRKAGDDSTALRELVAVKWEGRDYRHLSEDDLEIMDARDHIGPVAGEVMRHYQLRNFRGGVPS